MFIKTYIVLDESGAMHLKKERYFIIGGFVTKELHKVTSLHKRIEKLIKLRKKIEVNQQVEFKSSKININQQAMFLNELYAINNTFPVVIIIDKYNLRKFVASENVAYNFFVKNLINYLLHCQISILDVKNIELHVDNRNTSVKMLKDLETFLQWEFDLQKLNFSVKYLDSKNNRDVQMADYVANLYWKKYNKTDTEKLTPKIKLLNKTYVSKFPIKEFGQNPPLWDIEKMLQ